MTTSLFIKELSKSDTTEVSFVLTTLSNICTKEIA